MEAKKYIGEMWKPIKGYVGFYEVSNFGRVRSLDRYKRQWRGGLIFVKGKILIPKKAHHGYLFVSLSVDGVVCHKKVHRLVAETFIPNPKHLPCINHKDENTANCRLSNLEWCTVKYNNNYGSRLSRAIKTKKQNKLKYVS